MKLKNYVWNGYGFPVMFEELPAIKVRGELVPDVDFTSLAESLIIYLCGEHKSFTGNQIKFIRNHLDMSVRQFAEFMSVKHPSVLRWEKRGNQPTSMGLAQEILLRLKTLHALHSDDEFISKVVENAQTDLEVPKKSPVKPFHVPSSVVQNAAHAP